MGWGESYVPFALSSTNRKRMKNNLVVRPMKLKESIPVAALFKKIVSKLHYYNLQARRNEIQKYTARSLREKIAEDRHSVLVAYDNSQLVGFCFSRLDDYTVWLEWFGVSPECRRTGIGRALLAALERSLRQRKAHKIWCDCRTSNFKSKNILSSSGFKIIGIVRRHWYKQDFILWHKIIG